MPNKYYLIKSYRIAIILSTLVGLVPILLRQADIPGSPIIFVTGLALFAFIVWRVNQPVIKISENSLEVYFLFKTRFARWDEIEGMVIWETKTFGFKDNIVKILLKSKKKAAKEFDFSLKIIEKPNEILKRLREEIPERGYEDLKYSKIFQMPVLKAEVKHKKWTLNEIGIISSEYTIPWKDVTAVRCTPLVIAGFPDTMIDSVGKEGMEENFIVKATNTSGYKDFVRYLLQHSINASIDPGIVKMLEFSTKDIKADYLLLFSLVYGFVLTLSPLPFVLAYSPTTVEGVVYAMIVLICGLTPFIMVGLLLTGKIRGEVIPASKKIKWSSLCAVGPIFSFVVFCIFSPFSSSYMIGDVHLKTGNLKRAEYYYQQALKRNSDNIYLIFDMGELYFKEEEYEAAFHYLKNAYSKDSSSLFWIGRYVEMIPDALMKVGRYDEALQWCEDILKEQSDDKHCIKVILEKQDEILRIK